MFEIPSGLIEKYSMPDSFQDLPKKAAKSITEMWWETVARAGVIAETSNEDVIVELVIDESKFVINYSIDVFPAKGSLSNNPNASQRVLIESSKARAAIKDLSLISDRP